MASKVTFFILLVAMLAVVANSAPLGKCSLLKLSNNIFLHHVYDYDFDPHYFPPSMIEFSILKNDLIIFSDGASVNQNLHSNEKYVLCILSLTDVCHFIF